MSLPCANPETQVLYAVEVTQNTGTGNDEPVVIALFAWDEEAERCAADYRMRLHPSVSGTTSVAVRPTAIDMALCHEVLRQCAVNA